MFRALFKRLGTYFLAGVLAVLPLVITVGVVIWVAGFFHRMLGPDAVLGAGFQKLGIQFIEEKTIAYILGWGIVLAGVFALGVLLESGAKKFFQSKTDAMLKKIPIMGSIYGTARQLAEMLDTKADAELKKMSVVYCIFGQQTGAMFLALMPTPERFRIGEIDYHAILIPSAPVPFGGSLIFVPADSVHPADMTVDAFMSVYVSMGVSGPQFLPMSPGAVSPETAAEKSDQSEA